MKCFSLFLYSFQRYNGDSQSRVVYISLIAYLSEVESELLLHWGYFEHNTFKLKKCLWFYDGLWNSQVLCSWLVTLQKCEQLYFWKERKWSRCHDRLFVTPWTVAYQLLHPWDFPGKSTGVGCHCLLQESFPDPGIEPGSPALEALCFWCHV